MARSCVVGAACYVNDGRASHPGSLPAYCHNPAASAPDYAGASARTHGVMASMNPARRTAMPNNPSPERDPNAELRSFEPLRVSLAIGALLLGLILGFH